MNATLTIEDIQPYVDAGLVSRRESPCGRLAIYKYTRKCTAEGSWDMVTTQVRGVVFEVATGEMVARGFDKFFNWNEVAHVTVPNRPPDFVTRKIDGSCVLVFPYCGELFFCTQGSFTSEQALTAQHIWGDRKLLPTPERRCLIFEVAYPGLKSVTAHTEARLTLIGARDVDGYDYGYSSLRRMALRLNLPCVELVPTASIPALVESAKGLGVTDEGYVAAWVGIGAGIDRVKVKGAAYLRAHRITHGLTDRRIGDMWFARVPLPAYATEESRTYFDEKCKAMDAQVAVLVDSTLKVQGSLGIGCTRKEIVERVGTDAPEFTSIMRLLDGKRPSYREQIYYELFGAGPRNNFNFLRYVEAPL